MDHLLMLKTTGECWTKSDRTRRRFLRSLRRNVRLALDRAGVEGKILDAWSRLFVETDEPEAARKALLGVFGLHSISVIAAFQFSDLDDLVAQSAPLYRDQVAGRSFAVRAKRTGVHPFSSLEISRRLGSALYEGSAGVDLEQPDTVVQVEVVKDRAYCILDAVPGAGGLPLGTGGRAIALFSGGFDSPVAAWMAMSRGTHLQLLVCELVRGVQADAVLVVARRLAMRWAPGVEPRVQVVDLSPFVAELTQKTETRLQQVLLKRGMYRIARMASREGRFDAIVTGEAIGHASSQTVQNLAVAEKAIGTLVLRPLIGMGKDEILERARRIGTFEISSRIKEYCGIANGPVETAARLKEIEQAETALDPTLLELAYECRRTVDLVTWEPGPSPEHIAETVPDGAVVVDVREPAERNSPEGIGLPFSSARRWMDGLDPSRTYLFVCPIGLRSDWVAREMRRRGVKAFCLAGGIPRKSGSRRTPR